MASFTVSFQIQKKIFSGRKIKQLKKARGKQHDSFRRNPGFTFTEVLTVMGIMGILATIGYQTYIYHYNVTAKLSALQKLGTQAVNQMQICVEQAILNTGKETFEAVGAWSGCNSKALLNLQSCLDCQAPQLSTSKKALCMQITQGDLKQCVAYRIDGVDRLYKATVNSKVCVKRPNTSTAWTDASVTSVWPYIPCDADKDCCDANTNSACSNLGYGCKTFQGECALGTGLGGCK